MELIDTLWNVNYYSQTSAEEDSGGINRYIMECKYFCSLNLYCSNQELIDTLWNVN